MIVTPGTSWKWNSRSGVTPSCAASVVPAASATGAGRNRRSRSPIGDASATMPAVAVTESWNPIDHTSHGSRTRSTRTAAARTEPVARGLPDQHAHERDRGHHPRAHHRRLRRRSSRRRTTTVPTRQTEPRPPREPQQRRQPDDRRQHHRDVLAGDHQAGGRGPLAWKSRIMPGSSREASPSTSPSSSPASFAGKSRAIDRPTNARNTCAARMNGLGDGPRRSTWFACSSTTMPLCASASRNPGSSGRRITPSADTTSPRTHVGASSSALSHSEARSGRGRAAATRRA